jgi:hypothetical protein
MDTSKLKTIREFEGSVYYPHDISNRLQEGWIYLGSRLVREVGSKGEFEEIIIYIL